MIPYGKQDISQADIDLVVQTLKSDFLTQGPLVPKFEAAVASYTGAKYAVASNSATSNLHIACMALGLGEGDWLWTTPNTFVASANCGLYCGAKVDFVDIDSKTYNMSVEALEAKLQVADKSGKLPKIVVPVHFTGQSCDMPAISRLAKKYGFKIIEDASHAIGAKYASKTVGSCEHSDITVFSFHPVKIITTAEGGLAVTNDKHLAEKMALFRSHGITREADKMVGPSQGPWYYQQIDLGYNYRMTELQAALGISQMQRLDQFVKRRHQIAQKYDKAFSELSLTTPYQAPESYSSFHLYVVQVPGHEGAVRRAKVFAQLRERGIGVNVHYIPVHTQPYYQGLGFKLGDFPKSEDYYDRAISLPMFSGLSDVDQDRVISEVKEALKI